MANEKENPGSTGYRLQRRTPSLLKRQSLPAPGAQARLALVRRPLRDTWNLQEAPGSARGGPKEPGSECGDGLGVPGKRTSVPERRFSLDSANARPCREPVAMAAKGGKAPLKELTNRAREPGGEGAGRAAKEPSLEATFEIAPAADDPRPAFFPALLGADPDRSLPVGLLQVEEDGAGAAGGGALSPVSEHLRQVHEKLSRRRYFREPSAGQPARRCLTPVLEELALPEEEKAAPLDRICSLYRSFFAVECEGLVEQILSNPSSPAGRGGTPLLGGASAGGWLSIELEPPPQGPGLADSVVEPPCGGLEASEMSEVSLLNLDELDMELVKLKQAGGAAAAAAGGSEEPCSSPRRRSPVALLMERIQSLSSNAGSSLEGTFNVSDRKEGGQAAEADGQEGSRGCGEAGSPGAKANVTLILCPPSAAEPKCGAVDPPELAAAPGQGAVNENDTWELTLGGGEGKPATSDSKDRMSVGNSFSSDVCPLLGDLDSILSTDDSLVRSHPLISSTPLAVPDVFNFHQRATSNPAPSQREAVKANSSAGSEEGSVPPLTDRLLNSTRASCAAASGFPKPKPGTSTRRASLGGQPSGVAKNRKSLLPPPPPPPPPPPAKTGLQANCFSHPRMLDLPKPGPSRRLSLTYPSGPVGAAGSCPPSAVLRKPPRSAGKQLDGIPKPAARGQTPASSAGESSAGAPSSVLSRLSFGGRGEHLSTAGNRLQASGLPKPAASGLRAPVSRRSALGPKVPGTQPGRGTAASSTANPKELLGAPGSEVPGSSSRVRPQTPKLARKTADETLLPVAKRKKVDPVSSGIAVPKVPGSAGAPRGLRRPATRLSGRIPESRETGPPSSKGLQAGSALLTAPKLGLRPPSVCLSKRSKGAVPSADHGSATAQPQESEVSALSANVTFGAKTPPAATPEIANKGAAQSRLDPKDPSPERAAQDESSANVTFETARPAGPRTQNSVPSPPVNRTLDIASPGRAGSLQEEPAGGAAASWAGPPPQSDSPAAPLQNDDSSPSANLTFEAGERAGSPVEENLGVSSLDEQAASPPDKSQGSASCSGCAESHRESRALLARCRRLEEQLKAGSAQCELYCQENEMLQERCRLLEEQLKAGQLFLLRAKANSRLFCACTRTKSLILQRVPQKQTPTFSGEVELHIYT
uniref:Uncharacterized protein n=1 Tax=Lepisosteus oculatus TaxID=7918 RepID=W5NCK9_LEPOC